MTPSSKPNQAPAPGMKYLHFVGDTRVFTLTLSREQPGTAYLRSNLGHGGITREEIINEVDKGEPRLEKDWFDIKMTPVTGTRFTVCMPLLEVGHFEAKCYFLPDGETEPVWPEGLNTGLNVAPAKTCCANIIYNAFVRQFGPNISGDAAPSSDQEDAIRDLDQEGYAVIPPSGKFRDLISRLDFIIFELGCRVIQLLPVHPTPTTYGRMGQFGSPYASLGFLSIDPALATFDAQATPLEQFMELVDAVHERNALLTIDIAINHTGWAARLHESHPSWLVRNPDGVIQVPGAWGVKWEDLTKLDYTRKDLWQYMARVFITWCRRGVDGFRCDAGYMIPTAAWQYIVSAVREQYPETIFLNEGLGGKISVTRDLLNVAGFNWAYSELFQNYTEEQIAHYLPEALDISQTSGLTVHFSETHDNPRLANRSESWARMRTALCALFSPCGAFGFANGVEWYATEKINVHGAASLNWGAERNQVAFIAKLNALLRTHPGFQDQTELKLVREGAGNFLVMLRRHEPTGMWVLVTVNLYDDRKTTIRWSKEAVPAHGEVLTDLLGERSVVLEQTETGWGLVHEPGQVMCLTNDDGELDQFLASGGTFRFVPERVKRQRLRAKALEAHGWVHPNEDLARIHPDELADHFFNDPTGFCRSLNENGEDACVVSWHWPEDGRRQVMVPPGHFILVFSTVSFRARMVDVEGLRVKAWEESLELADGRSCALFRPQPTPESHMPVDLELSVFTPEKTTHVSTPLLFLAHGKNVMLKRRFGRTSWPFAPLLFMGSNGRGATLRAPVSWGDLPSRYDALLAANPGPNRPEDRLVLLTRCRGWVTYQGHSQEINRECIEAFVFDGGNQGCWRFGVPTGQGRQVRLIIGLNMTPDKNRVQMHIHREPDGEDATRPSDDRAVRIIVRPDIEWRSFHEATKAYAGPETFFPKAVFPLAEKSGFSFRPYGQKAALDVFVTRGAFWVQPEWRYMVHHEMDAERGFDGDSDLFSPGYFSCSLKGGTDVDLTACLNHPENGDATAAGHGTPLMNPVFEDFPKTVSLEKGFSDAVGHFVVKRGHLKTVIAGYPWFLDWGRDSLIFARGLVAAGRIKDAKAVLTQFGRFEENGTLPNMIHGENAANRDTSDAALWFFTACGDLLEKESDFLKAPVGERTIQDVLRSIGHYMIEGTENGVRMDPDSALIFSPAHFTWMDTNFPTGTPREGYPIEIQALWYAALRLLERIDGNRGRHDWSELAKRVQASVLACYRLSEAFLSDCLHALPGQPAKTAIPDDHLRPNQLFAITLGAVKEPSICRNILDACAALLVPGAIRSLADRPVRHKLAVTRDGILLNDPEHPYWGTYSGDEDTRRKPAYHNGTAWTWVFPSFCEAWVKTYGRSSREKVLAWLSSSALLMNNGCLGQTPEILDGDYPHLPRGCDAQAWGVSEWLRVWKKPA